MWYNQSFKETKSEIFNFFFKGNIKQIYYKCNGINKQQLYKLPNLQYNSWFLDLSNDDLSKI